MTFEDESTGVITASTTASSEPVPYTIFAKTSEQPNGMACDFKRNTLYYTYVGGAARNPGMLMAVDLTTGDETNVREVNMADGLWFDAESDRLYVGSLKDMTISVFEANEGGTTFVEEYPGLKNAFTDGDSHILDDITTCWHKWDFYC